MDGGESDVGRRRCGVEDVAGERMPILGEHQYPQTPVQLHLGLWDAGLRDVCGGDGGLERVD